MAFDSTTKKKRDTPATKPVPEWLNKYLDFAEVVRFQTEKAFIRTTKDVTVYKKVRGKNGGRRHVISLIIPTDTLVHVHQSRKKCRAEAAISLGSGWSLKQGAFYAYSPFEIMVPEQRFCRLFKICAPGIHFFFDRKDAQKYNEF